MTQQPVAPPLEENPGLIAQKCLEAYSFMILARTLEERLGALYRAGGRLFGGVYLGKGQEAFSAALAIQLSMGTDIYAPLIRDQAGRSAFGESLLDAVRTYLGSALGPMRGRDGNIHRGRPRDGMPAMISHLGSMVSVVAGMLIAKRMKGQKDFVGATSIGDGGTSTGAFHEGLNLAAVEKLPLIISVANNQFAYSTPTSQQYACADLVDRAIGYGVEGHSVDGTNLIDCVNVFHTATTCARAGSGPQLVVGRLLRLCGHGEHDDASYVPAHMRDSDIGNDCLNIAQEDLIQKSWLTREENERLFETAKRQVDEAMTTATRESGPDPYKDDWSALSRRDLTDV